MQNINWKIFRHPEFLQSLDMTLYEGKYLNLFLKRNIFNDLEKLKDMKRGKLISFRNGVRTSNAFAQEKVTIDI
ncbi:MAG: hypothetical protein EAX91_04760 [Candidatus Lokiarchaeota archaeon]|nr:hypothetical protein [Candidatus Lokiarchaeota archaeon]